MSVGRGGVKPGSGSTHAGQRVSGRRRLAAGEPDAAAQVQFAVPATKRVGEGTYGELGMG